MKVIWPVIFIFMLCLYCSDSDNRDRKFKAVIDRYYQSVTAGHIETNIGEYKVIKQVPELSNSFADYYEVEVLVEVKSMVNRPYYGRDTFTISWMPKINEAAYHSMR